MVVWNFGEKDIKTIRVILAAHGIYAAGMTDIDAGGIRTRRDITDTLMTGSLTTEEQNISQDHTAQSGCMRTRRPPGT
jgi:hypothetical protein